MVWSSRRLERVVWRANADGRLRPCLGIGLCALAIGTACASPMVGLDGFFRGARGELAPHIALALPVCAMMALAARIRLLAGLLVALAVALGADVIWTELVSARTQREATCRSATLPSASPFPTSSSATMTLASSSHGSGVVTPDVVVATEMSPRHMSNRWPRPWRNIPSRCSSLANIRSAWSSTAATQSRRDRHRAPGRHISGVGSNHGDDGCADSRSNASSRRTARVSRR